MAFAYKRPAFAYVIIFTFDRLWANHKHPKSDFAYTYTYGKDRLDRT